MINDKQMKSITDLIAEGWNREFLYRVAHMPDSPMFRTSKRGKFYVIPEKLEEFVSTRRVGR